MGCEMSLHSLEVAELIHDIARSKTVPLLQLTLLELTLERYVVDHTVPGKNGGVVYVGDLATKVMYDTLRHEK